MVKIPELPPHEAELDKKWRAQRAIEARARANKLYGEHSLPLEIVTRPDHPVLTEEQQDWLARQLDLAKKDTDAHS